MTGWLEYSKTQNSDIPYRCVDIYFTNGHLLTYTSKRKLGRVTLVESVENFIKEKRLGPDAYTITLENFISIVKKGKGYIKPRLMNQKAIAGIGNIYSDEILFQSKIRPQRKISEIQDGEMKKTF